jgi:hypothetical protein
MLRAFDSPDVKEAFVHPETAAGILRLAEGVLLDGIRYRVRLVDRLAFCDQLRFERTGR